MLAETSLKRLFVVLTSMPNVVQKQVMFFSVSGLIIQNPTTSPGCMLKNSITNNETAFKDKLNVLSLLNLNDK